MQAMGTCTRNFPRRFILELRTSNDTAAMDRYVDLLTVTFDLSTEQVIDI